MDRSFDHVSLCPQQPTFPTGHGAVDVGFAGLLSSGCQAAIHADIIGGLEARGIIKGVAERKSGDDPDTRDCHQPASTPISETDIGRQIFEVESQQLRRAST